MNANTPDPLTDASFDPRFAALIRRAVCSAPTGLSDPDALARRVCEQAATPVVTPPDSPSGRITSLSLTALSRQPQLLPRLRERLRAGLPGLLADIGGGVEHVERLIDYVMAGSDDGSGKLPLPEGEQFSDLFPDWVREYAEWEEQDWAAVTPDHLRRMAERVAVRETVAAEVTQVEADAHPWLNELVRELAAARHQRDLDAWGVSEPPIPAHLPPPEEVARRVLARAGVVPDPPADPLRVIAEAVAEAESLPPYERPATVGETARWVKTRLCGHAPLPADRMTAFLLAFAAAERPRRREAAADPHGSTVHAQADASTATGPDPTGDGIDSLLAANQPAGELYLMCRFSGQTPEALAALTGRPVAAVRRLLAAADHWLREELRGRPAEQVAQTA